MRSVDFCTRRVRGGGHHRRHECSRRCVRADHARGLLRDTPRTSPDAAGRQAEEDLTMVDVLAVVLALVMFAVLYVLIFGIERI
jgi:hypothetical protein